MDGSSFIADEQASEAPALVAPERHAAPSAPIPSSLGNTDKNHWLSVGCAALAHAALILFFLAADSDAIGGDGVALETIAVSIVAAVPSISAPEIKPSDTKDTREAAEEPEAQNAPDRTASKPETQPSPKPPLALDLPLEPVPSPDAPSLPVRTTERDPEPTAVTHEKPDKPLTERQEQAAAPSSSAPVTTGALPQFSSAEAAPGVVRAYARQISSVLDRNKPRARGMIGEVKVQFIIDTGGKPVAPKVLTSSGNPKLDEIVLAAIEKMEFPTPPPQMTAAQRTFNVPFAYRFAR